VLILCLSLVKKKQDNKNTYVLTQFLWIIGYQLLGWILDKTNNLGNAIPFQKPLCKALQDTAAAAENKFI